MRKLRLDTRMSLGLRMSVSYTHLQKPSLPEELTAGYKLYGKTLCAKVLSVKTTGYSQYDLTFDFGAGETALSTDCANIHEGDFIAVYTAAMTVCTPDDLHAQPAAFPHCITDGIFVLNEDLSLIHI